MFYIWWKEQRQPSCADLQFQESPLPGKISQKYTIRLRHSKARALSTASFPVGMSFLLIFNGISELCRQTDAAFVAFFFNLNFCIYFLYFWNGLGKTAFHCLNQRFSNSLCVWVTWGSCERVHAESPVLGWNSNSSVSNKLPMVLWRARI